MTDSKTGREIGRKEDRRKEDRRKEEILFQYSPINITQPITKSSHSRLCKPNFIFHVIVSPFVHSPIGDLDKYHD